MKKVMSYDERIEQLNVALRILESFMKEQISSDEYVEMEKLNVKMKEVYAELFRIENEKRELSNKWDERSGDLRELKRLESTKEGRKALKKARKKHDLSIERFEKRIESASEAYFRKSNELEEIYKKMNDLSSSSNDYVSDILSRLFKLNDFFFSSKKLRSEINNNSWQIDEYNYGNFNFVNRITSTIRFLEGEVKKEIELTEKKKKAELDRKSTMEIIDKIYTTRVELDKVKYRIVSLNEILSNLENSFDNPNYLSLIKSINESVEEYNLLLETFLEKDDLCRSASAVMSSYEEYAVYSLNDSLKGLSKKEKEEKLERLKNFYNRDSMKYSSASVEMQRAREAKEKKKQEVREKIKLLLAKIIEDSPDIEKNPLSISDKVILNSVGEYGKIDLIEAFNDIVKTVQSSVSYEVKKLEEDYNSKRLFLFEQVNSLSSHSSADVVYAALEYLNGEPLEFDEVKDKIMKKINTNKQQNN